MKSFLPIIFILLKFSINNAQNCKEPLNLKNDIELFNFGMCFIKEKANEFLFDEFKIPQIMKDTDPGLIVLVYKSRSISPKEEKQNWFNLYSMMSKEQIGKLYEILIREHQKLAEIEERYEQKKNEIKKKFLANITSKYTISLDDHNMSPIEVVLNNKKEIIPVGLKFLGSCINKQIKFDLWDLDINKDELTLNSDSKIICKCSEFEVFSPNLDENYDDIRELFIEHYINEMYNDPFETSTDSIFYNLTYLRLFPNYSIKFLSYGIRKFYSERKYSALNKLLYILPREVQHTQNKEAVNEYNYLFNTYNLYYSSILKDYNRACECALELYKTNNMDNDFTSIQNAILELWRLTTFSSDIKSKKCSDQLHSIIIKKFGEKIRSLKEIGNKYDAEIMLLDYITLFNHNFEIADISIGFKNLITNSSFQIDQENFTNQWYFAITNLYLNNNFKPNQTFDELRNEGTSLALYNGVKQNPNSLQSALYEYYSYYLLSCYKQNYITSKNVENYINIIEGANLIGNNTANDAYTYIEKHILNSIQNKLKLMNSPAFSNNATSNNLYAIVIGISDYKNLIPIPATPQIGMLYDLKFAKKDAFDFTNYLNNGKISGGKWKVSNFVDSTATEEAIKRKIQEILINKATSSDYIYIYFSGHGRTSDLNINENYLLTYDFNPNSDYSGIGFRWLLDQIRDSKAKHIVMFIDACKSGLFGNKGRDINQLYFNQTNMLDNQRIFITSASDDQLSDEDDRLQNGVFTHFLLKGLKGDAPEYNDPDFVNLNELRDYIREKVTEFRKKQFPNVVGNITNENFPMSLRQN